MSAGSPALTGLFQSEEKCIVFLDIVQELVNATLMDAYRSAANLKFHEMPAVLQFSPYIAERFRYALDLIPNWPYQILQQEEERALQRCSAIYDCYRYMVEAYAKEINSGGNMNLQNLPLPPLPAFLHDIYNEFIHIPEVRNGVYFQMYGIHRKSTVADAIRAALRKLVSKLMDINTSAGGGTGNSYHNPIAAGPYLSPGPSISQRPPLAPSPKSVAAAVAATTTAKTFPVFPATPKTTALPPLPTLPPTPAKTPSKTPFQKAIEIDMNAVSTPTPKHDREPSDSEE